MIIMKDKERINNYIINSSSLLYCLCKIILDNDLLNERIDNEIIVNSINEFITGYENSPVYENIFIERKE